MNPLKQLANLGQSVWLDYIRRQLLVSGELQRLIDEDGVTGMTSNPTIFDQAITGSHDYDESLRALARAGKPALDIYDTLSVQDVRMAADLFRPVYDRTAGRDGYVSLEVSPHLSHATEETIAEARLLWHKVDRANLFIKVPGTPEGVPAIRELISEGINVNVTLLFGLPRYREAAEAYLAGLEVRAEHNRPLRHVASVASFFLSRIDTLVDEQLEAQVRGGGPRAELAKALRGRVAIASAKAAYLAWRELFESDRFRRLEGQGARPQRLLWASTSTKNPAYSDVKYVEALIGPGTVNTLPPETLKAYRDHGEPALRLQDGAVEAPGVLDQLAAAGIDLSQVARRLEAEGVEKFVKPFDHLIKTIEEQGAAAGKP